MGAHELIDYFDENGNHLGVIDKAIAHRDGLWHKSIHAWIYNPKTREVLFQLRCADKSFYPNVWDCSFAGHVGAGEDTVTSAIREAEEEIGLSFNPNELKYLFTIKEHLTQGKTISNEFVDVFFITKEISLDDLKYQKEEVADAKYFKIDSFAKLSQDEKFFYHKEEFEKLDKMFKKMEITK